MKNKKLIPFIMGCAMLAATSLSAHAAGITGDASQDLNEFTKYVQDGDNNETIFKTDNESGLGNGTQYLTDSETDKYGTRGYAKGTATSNDANVVDPNSMTNLWTTISSYVLNVPAKTVIPLGASRWNIGQVEITEGKAFLNPDKVKVDITTKPMCLDGNQEVTEAAKKINYDIRLTKDATSTDVISDSSVSSGATQKHIYFYYNGKKGESFPYTYTNFDKTTYDSNNIAEVNQGQHVWVNCEDWDGKKPGVYQGQITFTASIEAMPKADIATNGDVSAYSGT